jgi:Fe-S cluster assembly ATP-binding protein
MALIIENLAVSIENKAIIKGLNLEVKKGTVHAIMGPNGAGKSTLAKVLTGDPSYEIINGDVTLDGASILEMEPDERSHLGLFMSFQYPPEIPGISNTVFLKACLDAKRKKQGQKKLLDAEFEGILKEKMALVNAKTDFETRNLNQGFSGGEKKRNEILQMAILEPTYAILDETDSGLDIDALKIVASSVNKLKSEDNAIILITHYQRLLDYIEPDFIHVMMDGKIVLSGDKTLSKQLEANGYDWIESGAGI